MCGRFVSTTPLTNLAEQLLVDEVRTDDDRPNWNVTPRAPIPIVASTADHVRVLDRVRWGLVPSWAKDLKIGDRQINARAETLRERPAYRHAFKKKRCLIPVDGFYEWQVVAGQKAKQPVFIHRPGGELVVFAGLYEMWKDKSDADAPWIRTCAIVTTAANETIAPVHNRMPVVLPAQHHDTWLDPDNDDVDALSELLVPAPESLLQWYAISTAVNRPANNSPELLEPLAV